MSNKNKGRSGIIYSTNPAYNPEHEKTGGDVTLPPNQQDLRVMHDRKQRAGKTVTLVTGFIGTETDLEVLGKMLKTKCGTGGSVKDGEIIIQGEFRDKVVQLLLGAGYRAKPKGG